MNLEVNFKFPWTLSTAAKGGVLCKCIQICKPIVVAPSYIVAQQGASQVVVLWRELKGKYKPQRSHVDRGWRKRGNVWKMGSRGTEGMGKGGGLIRVKGVKGIMG